MNAHEALPAELLKKVAQSSPQHVLLIRRMNVYIIIICFERMDTGAVDQAQSLAGGNQEAIADAGSLPGHTHRRSPLFRRAEPTADAIEGTTEALLVIGFQKVIDG